ncbi:MULTISPECIES: LuxR C-terminal-related transcriptional regulator [unclassified Microbacterium]|uniref:LuxR C-terminal-related transcriptional regulator n=1 Tax=Microbacterium TaxID=33882 RepID=UPI003B9E3494
MTSRASFPTAPRPPSGSIVRPRLLAALDGPERLCIVRAAGGTGKTTLLTQWAEHAHEAVVVWIDGDPAPTSRASFWLRALTQVHARGLVDDATLYREVAAIADAPDDVESAMRRTLDDVAAPVTLIVDGVHPGAHGDAWDEVAHDLLRLLRDVPSFRCIVATSQPTALEHAEPSLERRVLTEADLALTDDEVRAVAETASPWLSTGARDLIAGNDASRHVGSLRYSLDAVARAGERESVDVLAHAHRELIDRLGDSELRDFVGATALSPVLDADLARELTGRDDASELLSRLESAGAGHWTESHTGARLFRYGTHVRAQAAAEFAARKPDALRGLHARIAQWLFHDLKDDMAALEHALEARDLEFAGHVALRALPVNRDEGSRVVDLLRRIPAVQIHRHPLLALWYGLVLNADPATHSRAAEFFASAGVMARLQSRSLSPWERAVHRGLESVVWRMLGQPRRMIDAARRCIDLLEEMEASPSPEDRLADIASTLLYQSGVSAFYADEPDTARRAFSALVEFSDRHDFRHRRNAALSGLAFLDAMAGRVTSARRTLERIVDADWPHTWRDGYMGALARIARAWVLLSEPDPQGALDELTVLDPHFDTIEHWELILIARVLAESMLGRRREAAYRFERVRAARTKRSTLPSSLDRLATAEALLDLVTGHIADVRRRGNTRRSSPLLRAVEGMAESALAGSAGATPLIARAERDARDPVDELFAAISATTLALRTGARRDTHRTAARIAGIVSEHGLRWPLVLVSPSDRERILSALEGVAETGTAQVLRDAFAAFPAQIDDSVWGAEAAPVLSRRETVVLHALAETGSRAEIAERLFVSVNTVKAQLRSLYTKLGVSSREEALARAIALDLLSPAEEEGDEEAVS